MGKAQIRISPELMADVMHFPPGTRVLGSLVNGQYVSIVVEHSDLKSAKDGEPLPLALPGYRRQDEVVVFEGWGQ